MKKGKLIISLFLALVFVLGFSSVAWAARSTSSGTITGVVKDMNTGAAISGATVSNGTVSATTDASGNYTLTAATGSNTLQITATGYQTTWQICNVTAGSTTTVNWSLIYAYGTQPIPAANMDYAIFAWNDLGMHCGQDDYDYFCVLPPYNTLHVQVKNRNNTAGMITSGLTVKYNFPKKTNSALHTNFWQYAAQYGWNVPVNMGIAGNGLSGEMKVDANALGFVADGIPVTPYDDDGTWDPYGTADITVLDANNNVLQTASVVAPVSSEMSCFNCHGTTDPQGDILRKHDAYNGTTLATEQQSGIVHRCSECHKDNAVGAPGQTGVESLSLAMHNFHKDKLNYNTASSNTQPGCYNCHPGPNTQCMRGVMAKAGESCTDCHGDLYNMASSQQNGREAWLQEPKCANCHDSKHQENANTLYRNSILNNSPNRAMNNELYCESCHNSTHGEFTSRNAADSTIPQKFQGDNYWIWNCTVCHPNKNGTSMHK